LTTETLTKNKYNANGLSSKPVMHADWVQVDLVINMSGLEKQQVFEECDKVEDWDVEDPYGADLETYQRVFDDIRARIARLIARLRASQSTESPISGAQRPA